MDKRKRPFNKFETDGDVTKIFIERKNGEEFITLIDTEDLDKLPQLNTPLQLLWSHSSKAYYARFNKYIGVENGKSKYKQIYLHRLIMDVEGRKHVDHINHNTLDNRKCNLRVIEQNKNLKHRSGKNSNNKSGYRNVCWVNRENKWIVQLQINGKRTILGKFDDVHDAGKHAEEMRQKYYGEFAGVS